MARDLQQQPKLPPGLAAVAKPVWARVGQATLGLVKSWTWLEYILWGNTESVYGKGERILHFPSYLGRFYSDFQNYGPFFQKTRA
jgi:hypothetical protein